MSWFANPFARTSDPHEVYSDPDDEDDREHGHGVKEDLSQLTQTFKRQLWDVASFLAPPPQATYHDNTDVEDDQDGVSVHDDSESKAPDASQHDHHQVKAVDLPEELVDVDFESLLDETLEDNPTEAPKGEDFIKDHMQGSMHSDGGLTGISKDLAEIKGSVATGFSNFMRAVREEIKHVEISKSDKDRNSEDEHEINSGKATNSTSFLNSQRFNMAWGPLMKTVISSEKGKGLEKVTYSSSDDGNDKGDKSVSIKDHDHVLPSNFQDAFVHGFKGISKFASSFLAVSLSSDTADQVDRRSLQAVGITEEVLAFARNISMHSETWLDFPSLPDDEIDDFQLSAAQKEHVQALEIILSEISALKTELCPGTMTESRFWKIYFITLHSRLSKTDALLLSTPKVMQARAYLAQRLQGYKECDAFKPEDILPETGNNQVKNVESNQGRPQISDPLLKFSDEAQMKNVANTVKLSTPRAERVERNADRWVNEESLAQVLGMTSGARDEDDVSFSDLEDDDGQITKDIGRSSSTRSFDWVPLNKTSSGENFDGLKLPGSKFEDAGQQWASQSSQARRKQDQSESSDWSTLEEDYAASSD